MRFTLSHVLVPDDNKFHNCPALFCRFSSQGVDFIGREGAFKLHAGGCYDFSTYFNALPALKWREYASVDNVHLCLKVRGECTVRLTWAGSYDDKMHFFDVQASTQAGVEDEQVIDLEYPAIEGVLLSFTIDAGGDCLVSEGEYYTLVDEARIRPVHLKLIITTYKREEYILENLAKINNYILESGLPIANGFEVIVVDNGRTLDHEALNARYKGIRVFPNNNVGGSGGFARGMIEAMRAPNAGETTHLLLMDDDVVVSTEGFKRAFNLLSLVNDEYKHAFISGAMIGVEDFEDQYEDVGNVDPGRVELAPIKPLIRLNLLRDIILNEDFPHPKGMLYAAWWYCCIPFATVQREGLPMPFFIRNDDVEYGLRSKPPKFMTMNGICVWHASFFLRYNAVYERYFLARNLLVLQALGYFPGSEPTFANFLTRLQLDLKRYDYASAELLLEGIEDFLKGPEFLMDPPPQDILAIQKAKLDPMVDRKELEAQVGKIDVSLAELLAEKDGPRSFFQRVTDLLTWNGHRLPDSRLIDEPAFLPYDDAVYFPHKTRLHKTLVFIDRYNDQACVRTMDKPRFKRILKRYKQLRGRCKRDWAQIQERYQSAHPKMTSVPFWKQYLDID
jgi:GT2 family glycosyltransferase